MSVLQDLEKLNTLDEYLSYLSTKKSFILQHIMKIFYYTDFDEGDNLSAPSNTANHWAKEICEYFDLKRLKFLSGNCLPKEYYDELTKRIIKKLSFDTDINLITSLMTKTNKFKPHELPLIPHSVLKSKWTKFVIIYYKLMNDLIARVTYQHSDIDFRKVRKYIEAGARVKRPKLRLVDSAVEPYSNFSYLEDDLIELINKYKLLNNH